MNYDILGDKASRAMQYDMIAHTALDRIYSGYLPWSSSSLRPAAIQIIINDILLNDRSTIVEFGSGLSTVFVAEFIARRGGRVVSVDDDSGWQQHVRNWVGPAAGEVLTLVHAPLRAIHMGDTSTEWYDTSRVQSALQAVGKIDLVLFDGPAAFDKPRRFARRPGLHVVAPYLASNVTIVLDDIMRAGERVIAKEWSNHLKCPFRDLTVRAGIGIWTRGGSKNVCF